MKSMFRLLTFASFVLGAGCASMSGKLDAQRAKSVKKLAILSLEIQQQKPTDNMGIGGWTEMKNGKPGDSNELQEMAKNIYATAESQIAKQTGWKVIPLAKVEADPRYAKLVNEKMSGARLTSFTDGRSEMIIPKGLLDNHAFRALEYADQVALAKSLGADAFAELVVYENIDQAMFSIGHLSGNASFKLTARSNLRVFGLDSPEVLWQVQNIDGDKSRDSDELGEKPTKLERLAKIGGEAAQTSLQKLAEKYHSM